MKITKRQLRKIIREGLLKEIDTRSLKTDKDGNEYPTRYEGFAIHQEPGGTWVGVRYDFGRQHRYPNHPTKESLFKIIDRHQKRNFDYQGDDAEGSEETRSLYTNNRRDQDLSKIS